MKVRVSSQGRVGRVITKDRIRRAAVAMLRALELPRAELSVLLCDDPTIHALNRTYRGKDKPTDVLAFAMREGPGAGASGDVLGDVVISIPTAVRQAVEHRRDAPAEILMLLAHGLLHLLGWDHRTVTEDRRMRREVARLVDVTRLQSENRVDSSDLGATRVHTKRRARE